MREYIKGGKAEGMDCEAIAKKHGVPLSMIEKQEAMGIKIEHEHSPDDGIAAEIARDHLAEFPTYYSFLEEMEAKAKADYTVKGYGKKQEPKGKKDKKTEAEIAQDKKDALSRLFGV